MTFARWVYWIAGAYGLLALVPQYLMFDKIGRDLPPAITHPEYFYGFLGVAIAWQTAFLIIGSDPSRFRSLMPVSVFEKLSFAIPVSVLFAQGRVAGSTLFFGMIDLVLGILFFAAWRLTVRSTNS